MDVVYWKPEERVERIYLNIPRQKVVSAYLKRIVPSARYRWDFQLTVSSDAFIDQPELRRMLIDAVGSYVFEQLNKKLRAAGINKTMATVTWNDLLAAQKKLGVLRAMQPRTMVAAGRSYTRRDLAPNNGRRPLRPPRQRSAKPATQKIAAAA